MIKNIICILTTLFPAFAYACKDPLYTDKYPITNFSGYSDVILARVIESRRDDEKIYSQLISFDAVVSEKIKGSLKVSDVIHVSAKVEEPHAACSLHFKEDSVYLLLLERLDGKIQISRFSFPIESSSSYFSSYVLQVKSNLNIP